MAGVLRAVGVADTVYLVMCLMFQTVKTVHEVTDWLPALVRAAWPYTEPYVTVHGAVHLAAGVDGPDVQRLVGRRVDR